MGSPHPITERGNLAPSLIVVSIAPLLAPIEKLANSYALAYYN
jgi:hypothetical protein